MPATSAAVATTAASGPVVARPLKPALRSRHVGPTPSDGQGCRVVAEPRRLSMTGAAAFVGAGEAPRVVFNDDGVARFDGAKGDSQRKVGPACAVTDANIYCVDRAGAIWRTDLAGAGRTRLAGAQAHPRTAIAAVTHAGHEIVAFLQAVKTANGVILAAYVVEDGGTPRMLSEEGSGATFVSLRVIGDEVAAVYLDARTALTMVHARMLSRASELRIGEDVVLFITNGTDEHPQVHVGALGGRGLVAAALPDTAEVFGMVTAKLEPPLTDDAPVVWSLYPAPAAGALLAIGAGATEAPVLRSVPQVLSSESALELGRVGHDGAFALSCSLAQATSFDDVALYASPKGVLWLAYTNQAGSWLEARGR